MDHIRARYALIVIWMILYLIFTCLFAVHLNSWSFDVSRHCYNTSHISLPNARHPYVDHIYIAFTCLYVLSSVYLSVAIANSKGLLDKLSNMESYNFNVTRSMIVLLLALFSISTPYHFMVLNIAMLQYPLHVYTLFTIRANNEGSLTNGSEEKQWGFAQIGAMVLLATNVLLLNGVQGMLVLSLRERVS